jgi:signal transduction histidine kinase/Na+/proline symporter
MSFDLTTLLIPAGLYLLILHSVALATEKGRIPKRLLNHPAIYVLSLAIIVSTFGFYTIYTPASARGNGYNAYYIGYAAAFLLAPILLKPVLQITKTYHLSSLPDLFAFRFRSQWAGILSSIIILIAIFPLLSLQIYAVATSTNFLVPDADPYAIALGYCLIITLFSLRFGTGDVTGRSRNDSIVMLLAFEAVFKMLVLIVGAVFAIWGIFGGLDGLQEWLDIQTPAETGLDQSFLENTSNLLIMLYFSAAIAMPHMFHVVFHENRDASHLKSASWGIPMYLLFASLPVLPILWASSHLGAESLPMFSMLWVGLLSEQHWFVLLAYTGGIAASCGVAIVMAISVSSLCLNHLILPLKQPPGGANLYQWLLLGRRMLVVAILLGGYFSFLPIADGRGLGETGFIAFIACVQFLPGILTMLYWPPANSKGFISGLLCGLLGWLILGLLPLSFGVALFDISFIAPGLINWNFVASASMIANLCTLVVVSLFTSTSKDERLSARMCSMDSLAQPMKRRLLANTPGDFIACLSAPLGIETARKAVMQAVEDLGFHEHETRPHHLQQLRVQVEANLSALLGATVAHQLMERFLPFSPVSVESTSPDLGFMEQQLETWPVNLSGIALDLDLLRRHHRQVLQNLPLAVCAVDALEHISLWNQAMVSLTDVPSDKITGMPLGTLPQPWRALLTDFIRDDNSTHIPRMRLGNEGKQYCLSLHKSALSNTASKRENGMSRPSGDNWQEYNGQIVIIEDQTETTKLEAELAHAERLSSIGRLAAGVAHEIGNPVTGIACLAQNLRDETHDEELKRLAEQIIQQTRRISGIMHSLVSFSHSGMQADQPVLHEPINLYALAEDAISLMSLKQDGRNVLLVNTCDPAAELNSDRQRLLQVLLNLLSNARDASMEGGIVQITAGRGSRQIMLEVTDTGCGIPPQLLDRVFEPFFTTKDPGKGTGLGLPLVYRIVKDLGGTIQIRSATVGEKGTRVIVIFPCYDPAPVSVAA